MIVYGTYKVGQGIYNKVTQVNTAGTLKTYGNNNLSNTTLYRNSPYSGEIVAPHNSIIINSNMLNNIQSLDDFVNNPDTLKHIRPEEMYNYLRKEGHDPSTLSKGKFKGVPFEDGGGFKITWGGDRILQYHPEGGIHSGSYWKVSSGPTGIKKIPISGKYIP